MMSASQNKLPPHPKSTSKQTPTLLESTKPKGFPSGSKRLQPIKATDLKNVDMMASPMTAGSNVSYKQVAADSKKNDISMMRMT